jgi:hypothetical protein
VNLIIYIHVQILRIYILVPQNSLKSPFLHSQIRCNFLGIFPQIFLPPESLYSISNPILIHKSIKIDFLLLYWISAREMVSARPPPFFSSPAVAHLLPPFLAQLARRLPLTDRWAHPVSEPSHLLPPAPDTLTLPLGRPRRVPPCAYGHLLRMGPDASRPPPPFPSLNRRRQLFASPP